MRTIKFRGKRLDNSEWCHGYYTFCNDTHTIQWINEDGAPWWADVDPSTVGLLTGLLDRNGKEIYEGDILAYKWFDGNIVEVDYYPVNYLGGAFCLKGEYDLTPLYEQDMKRYEVVGNIHDNPELLNRDSQWVFAQP